jgi:hypothetical protein
MVRLRYESENGPTSFRRDFADRAPMLSLAPSGNGVKPESIPARADF